MGISLSYTWLNLIMARIKKVIDKDYIGFAELIDLEFVDELEIKKEHFIIRTETFTISYFWASSQLIIEA